MPLTYRQVNCLHCGKSFNKTPADIARTHDQNYCSRSCSATRRRGIVRNPPKPRTCTLCTGTFQCSALHRSRKHCPSCFGNRKHTHQRVEPTTRPWRKRSDTIIDYRRITLSDVINGGYVKGKHRSHVYDYVRRFNRSWNKALLKECCRNCSYSKHVELAHLSSISSFPLDTPLGVINDPRNVVPLCPNCHWEFDAGHIDRQKLEHPAGLQPATLCFEDRRSMH